jgi:hypothetical protein
MDRNKIVGNSVTPRADSHCLQQDLCPLCRCQFFSIKKQGFISPAFFGLEYSKIFQGQLWFG